MKPSEVEVALKAAKAINKPVMIWGSPGIGKSETVASFAKKSGMQLFDIRLALLDPTDLRGIPYFDPDSKTAKWGSPSMLPQSDETPSLLFLDEINAAPPSIQAAAYQLVLDRKVGEFSLPDNCFIVAAGNRAGDRGVVHEMPAPLENRFIHIDFEVNSKDWITWAVDNKKHPDTVGYISYSPGSLNDFDPKNKNDHGFPTPRSWSTTSDILVHGDNDGLSPKITKQLISGTIGPGKSIEFLAYQKISSHLPNPMDILTGKVTTFSDKVKDEISAHYSMIVSLVYSLNEVYDNDHPDLDKYMDNFMEFLDKNVQPEFNIFAMSTIASAKKINPIKFPSFSKWSKKYNKFF